MINNYYKPTPKIWRKIGDTALLGCTAMNGPVLASPLTDNEKMWTIFIISIIGVAIKMTTNFFKEPEDPILPSDVNTTSTK